MELYWVLSCGWAEENPIVSHESNLVLSELGIDHRWPEYYYKYWLKGFIENADMLHAAAPFLQMKLWGSWIFFFPPGGTTTSTLRFGDDNAALTLLAVVPFFLHKQFRFQPEAAKNIVEHLCTVQNEHDHDSTTPPPPLPSRRPQGSWKIDFKSLEIFSTPLVGESK